LLPDRAGLAESLGLVQVIVSRREILDVAAQSGFGESVMMLNHRHTEFGGANRIGHGDIGRGKVNGRDSTGLFHGRGHGVEELRIPGQASDTNDTRALVYDFIGKLRRALRIMSAFDFVVPRGMSGIARSRRAPVADRIHARRGDLVFGGQLLLFERVLPTATSPIDHRRHAVRQF